jgi:hypothetical protein
MNAPDPPREDVDPGPPVEELAGYRIRSSDEFWERLQRRIDRYEARRQLGEFTLRGVLEVLREYGLALLALLVPRDKEHDKGKER